MTPQHLTHYTHKLTSIPVAAIVVLSVCLAACNHNARPHDFGSLSITLSRTACQLECPVYTVNVHGTGEVEYDGFRGVGVEGHRTVILPREKIEALAETLDKARFMSLDDRAFQRATDFPYAILSVSLDGLNKRVQSADPGLPIHESKFFLIRRPTDQQRFLELTYEIDTLVGTDRWTKCNEHCSATNATAR